MFDTTSRYYEIDSATLTVTGADGTPRLIAYKRRRFIPSADSFTTVVEHTVAESERLDLITANYLDDPTQFWRICDANGCLRPDELEQIGRVIRIATQSV